MDFTRIIELFIDDDKDESGIEAISLVSRPAHDETWLAFNAEEEVETYNPYKVVADDFCSHNPLLNELGEPYEELLNDGWEIVRVEKMTPQAIHKMNQERFSTPNEASVLDNESYRIRYKYAGPRDNKNRQFCADMLRLNRVYRIEDIDRLSDETANEEFGFYEIFTWRGSYNCRHQWVRLIYKKTGKIDKSARVSKGLIDDQTLSPTLQPDTRNLNTINTAEIGETKAGIPVSETQWRPGVARQGGEPFFSNQNKVVLQFQSYNDYPDSAKNNACKVLRWRDEHGDDVKGMTQVGWTRANQLCKGENISEDTIARMSAFQRHKKNSEVAPEFKDTPWKDAGYVAWLGWGGTSGVNWASNKLQSIRKMSEEEPKQMMFMDDEKRIVVGAAMVPNKMIHRYDALGNMYYVFFSKKTIERMAQKFLRQKRTDETSVEHDGIKLGSDKVWITESWISEDPEKDKSAAYGFNLPAGTWFVSMKVEDNDVWKMIKEKQLTGFSVEGLFAEKSVFSKEDEQINQIKAILKSIKDE